jgi:hypothetical protein
MSQPSRDAADRVHRFLEARRHLRGVHPEEIASVTGVASDHEIVALTVTDLRCLIRAQRSLHALRARLRTNRSQKGPHHGQA